MPSEPVTDGDTPPEHLSPREAECLQWAARGKSATDTAAILGLSARTVEAYLERGRSKLGVRTRIEAVAKAVSLGLISPS